MSVRRSSRASRPASQLRLHAASLRRRLKHRIAKYPEGRAAIGRHPASDAGAGAGGWVTKAAIEHVADMLDMPYIRALEVATFYTQFQLKPVGTRAHVQVCGTTPCMMRGAEALMDVCRTKIHHDQFHTNDGRHALLGGGRVPRRLRQRADGHDLQGHLRGSDAERLAEIIDAFAGSGECRGPGPQIDRIFAAPQFGADDTPRREGGTSSRHATGNCGAAARKAKRCGAVEAETVAERGIVPPSKRGEADRPTRT